MRRREFLGYMARLATGAAAVGVGIGGREREASARERSTMEDVETPDGSIEEKTQKCDLIEKEGVKPGFVEALKEFEGKAWVGKMEGNGNRDVAICVSDGFDPTKPFEMIYHFHGTDGHLVNEKIPHFKDEHPNYRRKAGRESVAANRLQQVLKATGEVNKIPNRNVITVYPLSAGRRGGGAAHRNGYDDRWMGVDGEDMGEFHQDVLRTLQSDLGVVSPQVESTTIKGHSAGGKALANVVKSGFKVDRVDYLDASYPGWAQSCYRYGIKSNSELEMNLFVRSNTTTEVQAKTLEGKTGIEVIRTSVPHAVMNEKFFGWERD